MPRMMLLGAGSSSSLPWYADGSTLASSIVAYWPLDEASGNRAALIGGHTLTDTNTVASATGLLSSLAADFDPAANESLSIASTATLQTGNIDWWCAAWFRPEGLSSTRAIFGQFLGADRGHLLHISSTTPIWLVGNGSGSTSAAPSGAALLSNRWYFAVCWIDKVANTANLQISGGLVISVNLASTPGLSDATLMIGAAPSLTTYNFDGQIGPVVFGKNHLITAPERRRIFDAGLNVMAPGSRDVYIVAGQSNASGRGTNSQVYSHATLKPLLYNNAYHLTELIDPTDIVTGQVDTVSSDTSPAAFGSVWPLVATQLMAANGRVPIFVPCAKGGSSITAWLPGADHQDRTTLYGSMIYRALQAANYGTLRGVLWWQGETDALAAMSQATYNGHLDTIADAVFADLGVKLMPCKMQTCGGIGDADELKINNAIGDAWADNANVATGPNLTSITADSGDQLHLNSDGNLLSAATLWTNSIIAAWP